MDDVNRRELLRLISVTGAALALPAAGAPTAAADALDLGPGAADSAQLNAHLWRVYALTPTKQLVQPLVSAQIEVLVDALGRAPSPAERELVCEQAADLFQLAGEVLLDGNRHTDASRTGKTCRGGSGRPTSASSSGWSGRSEG
ncbi:hypothetical protein [Actinokineospora bangkokensis]|uniref:Uncharacterized protein n=1 Tax=Actinokineospora bangkokensis TaxID=1193682 RepID=A0A1Q9LSD6_9PSEU|nr:hypothetical protein [Actinokineospora bangkokensis]OLR94923.1 hypothetical protein BJP25_08065 [Actinokineospora bangkokensis]